MLFRSYKGLSRGASRTVRTALRLARVKDPSNYFYLVGTCYWPCCRQPRVLQRIFYAASALPLPP